MSGLWLLVMLILSSAVPALLLYGWFRVTRYPFSATRFLLTLLAGAAAFVPALVLRDFFPYEFAASGKWTAFARIFLQVALTEELGRLVVIAVFFRILRGIENARRGNKDSSPVTENSGYRKVIDASAMGLAAGLGFAILENAAYGAAGASVVLLRLFTAAPLHGACGARVGAAAVIFRQRPVQAFFRFCAAVAIHGLYNAMIIISGLPAIAAVVIALSALVSSILSIYGGISSGKSIF